MPLKDQIVNSARKLVESRPSHDELEAMLRPSRPLAKRFYDDGVVPNNSRWPVLLYRGVVRPNKSFDAGAVMDAIFERNGWGRSWRDSIYDFVHYHSRTHEVLGIAKGRGVIECGGVKGAKLRLKDGDVLILPAGTAHRLIEASKDLLVVGAYPPDGVYDECTDTRDRVEARKRIAKVKKPRLDPVFGRPGPLAKLWTSKPAKSS